MPCSNKPARLLQAWSAWNGPPRRDIACGLQLRGACLWLMPALSAFNAAAHIHAQPSRARLAAAVCMLAGFAHGSNLLSIMPLRAALTLGSGGIALAAPEAIAYWKIRKQKR
ncbi:hypothetical protein [Chromobacterium phragmitis]|uniref:Uncharacterized protein n=1 Tax=Chromobacterium phragmitis TaxID=2202141 RepID=A0A344UHV8_9NEIS|nr:hypothetical protein [Chromobacterium phragmitis]AXE34856.1 hypothetical protein DK843_11455 [Chromobacterium phragmitis]